MNDFAHQVAAHRPMLAQTARRMLRNDAWAEDAVSETLVAALENPDAFSGRSRLRTWLVAILKHKAIDQVRAHTRERQLDRVHDDGVGEADGAEGTRAVVDAIAQWDDPQECLSRVQFVAQLEACLKTLSPRQRQVFLLHDGMEKETAEICDELGITANHLGVVLHRARHRLRDLLHTPWGPASAHPRSLMPQV